MELIDVEEYEEWKKNNEDPYGAGVFSFAERWAELMEKEIKKGNKVKDIAERTSRYADTDGITGFMYGSAVQILSTCWKYGEELRVWHNSRYNYEGNGVVQPAVLRISEGE